MRSKRPFLLLELLIAMLITTSFTFPLAMLPMRALREEMKSLYRMQASRLADVGYAHLREELFNRQVSWDALEKGERAPVFVFEDTCFCSLSPSKSKSFKRTGTVKLINKKIKDADEWCLLMAVIEIKPVQTKEFSLFKKKTERKKDHKKFAYYTVIHRKTDIATERVP